MNLEIIRTDDGTLTLHDSDLNTTYHSIYGAAQEGNLVYVENGLNYAIANFGKAINLLEVGFGTGLHAYLTLLEATKRNYKVSYTSIDKFPIPTSICKLLKYDELAPTKELSLNYFDLIYSPWNVPLQINRQFNFKKIEKDIYEFKLSKPYHVVYYSGFSHQVTPEMWEKVLFEKLFNKLPIGACIVTQCSKGIYKRMLKEIGFRVDKLLGPPGKVEVTRAVKV